MITLKDTEKLMESSNYKDRFMAEYWQTKIRYELLKHFNTQIEAAYEAADISPESRHYNAKKIEEPKHDCPQHLLLIQQSNMGHYLHDLEVRAVIEDVDISLDHMVEIVEQQNTSKVRREDLSRSMKEAMDQKMTMTEYSEDK